jgi:hypothetical protein
LWRYLTDSQQRGTGATKHQRVAEPIVNVSLRLGKEAHRRVAFIPGAIFYAGVDTLTQGLV